MSKEKLDIIDAIQIALEAEKKAVATYSDAAEKATHSVLERLFRDLAAFEQHHYDKVAELATSLQKKGKYIIYEASSIAIPAQSEIELGGKAAETLGTGKRSLTDVLSMAQDIEQKASKRYAELAERTTDPDGKAMFEQLSKEEQGHLQVVSRAYWNIGQRGVLAWPSV